MEQVVLKLQKEGKQVIKATNLERRNERWKTIPQVTRVSPGLPVPGIHSILQGTFAIQARILYLSTLLLLIISLYY
jgi:hypothetical protein